MQASVANKFWCLDFNFLSSSEDYYVLQQHLKTSIFLFFWSAFRHPYDRAFVTFLSTFICIVWQLLFTAMRASANICKQLVCLHKYKDSTYTSIPPYKMIWTCCQCGHKSRCTTCECGHSLCLSCVYCRKPRSGPTPSLSRSIRQRWSSILGGWPRDAASSTCQYPGRSPNPKTTTTTIATTDVNYPTILLPPKNYLPALISNAHEFLYIPT